MANALEISHPGSHFLRADFSRFRWSCVFFARHALDIREHYERKLERANNLYMELSAIMLQLEMREKELIKYVSRPPSARIDWVSPSAETCCSELADVLFVHPTAFLRGCALHMSLPLGRFTVEGGCHRAGSRGASLERYLQLHPAEWLREGVLISWTAWCRCVGANSSWGSEVASASGLRYSWEWQENCRDLNKTAATEISRTPTTASCRSCGVLGQGSPSLSVSVSFRGKCSQVSLNAVSFFPFSIWMAALLLK